MKNIIGTAATIGAILIGSWGGGCLAGSVDVQATEEGRFVVERESQIDFKLENNDEPISSTAEYYTIVGNWTISTKDGTPMTLGVQFDETNADGYGTAKNGDAEIELLIAGVGNRFIDSNGKHGLLMSDVSTASGTVKTARTLKNAEKGAYTYRLQAGVWQN